MGESLTLLALMVLEGLEAGEGSSASEQLVGELCLVGAVRLVGLLVVIACLVWSCVSATWYRPAFWRAAYRNRTCWRSAVRIWVIEVGGGSR